MRSRVFVSLALAGLLLLTPATRADFKPAVLLRLKALEELIGDLRFVVKEVGKEEQAKQVEALLKARTGPNGLEGVNVKKPIGLYATVKPSLTESEVVLLLPIADEKAFLAFLDNLNLKAERGADGLYTMQVENVPVPLLFRFANGYLYGMAKLNEKMALPDKDKLPSPEVVLDGGSGILSLTANVDQIPPQLRKLAVSASALTLGEMKDRDLPGATEKQKALWAALLDDASRQVKAFLEDATTAQLKLDIDQKSSEVTATFTLDGKPGSKLVKDLAGLAPTASVAAGLGGKDSVMGGSLHLALPDAVKKAAAPAIEEAIGKAMDNADPNVRDLVAPLVEKLKPTATSGKLDVGLDMRGPGKKGKYTLVMSLQVEKGADVEKAFKDLIDKLPAEAKEPIKTDVATEGGVNVHRVTQTKVDEQAKEMFGTGPLYLALRDDAVFVTMGEDALSAIKDAIKAKPTAGQPARLTIAAAKLAPLMAKDQKEAPAAAKRRSRSPAATRCG
ncbi:MAG: hypothetical protein U0797_27620 [Gemmataceae bacterium]